MLDGPDETAGERRGIQSVEVGMGLIEALTRADGALTLKELAQAARLPASNCHRYCVSFVRSGYLKQDSGSGRYALGPRLIQAGLTALLRTDAVGVATLALERVVEATGHTGQLAIWADNGPTIVRWLTGRMAVRTSLSTGSTLPLLTSATGRVFLAFLPRSQTVSFAAREAMVGGGDADALAAQVRARGFAQVSGDHIPGLSAVAAPMLDAHGEAAASLTLVAAGRGFAPGAIDRLCAEAAQASFQLGWIATSKAKIG